jgi:hypothetical protein
MTDFNQKFLNAYLSAFPRKTVCTDSFPKEMQASEKDKEGWIEWKPMKGTLQERDYHQLEQRFGILFPKSFIDWHRSYHLLEVDCSIIRLPASSPARPLEDLKQILDWFIPEQLIPHKLYPFAAEGNDAGPIVFDGRLPIPDNEFPIRVYDHEYGGDLEGLSDIIFSSFSKLLECLTHHLTELKTKKNFEIIPEFFKIDPHGAGKTGVDYWLSWARMQKANFEEFGY